jgi:short-subunit dehydrogenase
VSTIAVFGAGQGLGRSVALRYARNGYDVALVARRAQPLERIAEEVTALGVAANVVTGDLSDIAGIPALAERVSKAAGNPDVVYFGPISADEMFVPASALTVDAAEKFTALLFTPLVALVQEFLPHMLMQGSGAILTTAGGSGLAGPAGMSGPGPSMAAQRNYLQSLEAEVSEQGVFVGRLYIAALITGSAADEQLQAIRDAGGDVPAWPSIAPDDLADQLWRMHAAAAPHEAVMPENNAFAPAAT